MWVLVLLALELCVPVVFKSWREITDRNFGFNLTKINIETKKTMKSVNEGFQKALMDKSIVDGHACANLTLYPR